VYKLGSDKKGRQWMVEVYQAEPSDPDIFFWVWPARAKRRGASRPPAQAALSIESKDLTKLGNITVAPPFENCGIGSLLLAFVERWACGRGIVRLYGDLSRVDADYLPKLKQFYSKHGWTWELFGDTDQRKQKSDLIMGRVEKHVTAR